MSKFKERFINFLDTWLSDFLYKKIFVRQSIIFQTSLMKIAAAFLFNFGSMRQKRIFRGSWYKQQYNINSMLALCYHICAGEQKNFNPSPYFDTKWYREVHLNGNTKKSPLLHHLLTRMKNQTHPGYWPFSDTPIHSEAYICAQILSDSDNTLNVSEQAALYKKLEGYLLQTPALRQIPFINEYSSLYKTRGASIVLDVSHAFSPLNYAKEYHAEVTYFEQSEPELIAAPVKSFNAEAGKEPQEYIQQGKQPYLVEIENVYSPSGYSLFFNDKKLYSESLDYTTKQEKSFTVLPQLDHDKKPNYSAPIDCHVKQYDKVILGMYNMDFNYYHWMVEGLPRIKMALDSPKYKDYSILTSSPLHKNCLEALYYIADGRRIIRINKRELPYIKCGIYPSEVNAHYKSITGIPQLSDFPTNMSYLKSCIDKISSQIPSNTALPKRIFFQRKYRLLKNKNEINRIFLNHGFTLIHPETLTFTEQVQYCRNADVFVSIGGSGAANLVFCKPKTPVCIFSHFGVYGSVRTWQMLASVNKADLYCCFGEKSSESDYMKVIDEDFTINPQYIQQFLAEVEAKIGR